jgi:alpha-2-macroglobulin
LAENLLTRGKVYKMSVTVTSSMERNFVAIRVPVPSGADIIENYPERSRSRWSGSERVEDYWPTYYGYESPLRVFDNEADVYIDNFSGYYSFSVPFRATGSGVYPTPAATAECMYEPEIFGRDIARLFKIAVE